MLACPGVTDAVSYGVQIPAADGRAGMAAIVVDARFSLAEFHEHLAGRLPAYACPVLIRMCRVLDLTETFKQKKSGLIRESFDPQRVKDPLFFYDAEAGAYRELDAANYARIVDGSLRL
jgi:fatty-acyl-CoA synthase